MDSGACKNLCDEAKESCLRSSPIRVEDIIEGNIEVSGLQDAAGCNGDIVPITPELERESGDLPIKNQTPLSDMKKPFKLHDSKSKELHDSKSKENGSEVVSIADNDSPKTPQDGVFDPFAPAPAIMARAPMCNKYPNDVRKLVVRKLDFSSSSDAVPPNSSCDDEKYSPDQDLFESVYENLLEFIVSAQTEAALSEISGSLVYDSADCKTPASTIFFNGIDDNCPGAPSKPGNKLRIVPLGLRRKLEF